jgi:predicted nucleotidyltransferase component of viral defense system
MERIYKQQVQLMLSVLPEVAREKCFALHGGTAINLFIRNMPRLSVDIDLTYLPLEDRNTSISRINEALSRISLNIEKRIRGARITTRLDAGKILIHANGVDVKIEVNLVNRGVLSPPVELTLCSGAQASFDAFCEVQVAPLGQLFGGKIIAALDRQHPRDLFDVQYLLAEVGITDEIRLGFIHYLLCSVRPTHEILMPNFKDQRAAFDNQFSGMTAEPFTYDDFERARISLSEVIVGSLTTQDRSFILRFNELDPDWSIHDFQAFPAIQ